MDFKLNKKQKEIVDNVEEFSNEVVYPVIEDGTIFEVPHHMWLNEDDIIDDSHAIHGHGKSGGGSIDENCLLYSLAETSNSVIVLLRRSEVPYGALAPDRLILEFSKKTLLVDWPNLLKEIKKMKNEKNEKIIKIRHLLRNKDPLISELLH